MAVLTSSISTNATCRHQSHMISSHAGALYSSMYARELCVLHLTEELHSSMIFACPGDSICKTIQCQSKQLYHNKGKESNRFTKLFWCCANDISTVQVLLLCHICVPCQLTTCQPQLAAKGCLPLLDFFLDQSSSWC